MFFSHNSKHVVRPVLSPIMIWVLKTDGRTTFSQLPAMAPYLLHPRRHISTLKYCGTIESDGGGSGVCRVRVRLKNCDDSGSGKEASLYLTPLRREERGARMEL